MKNSLQINAVNLDARKVSEETLAAYNDIQINCILLQTNERAQTLLAKHDVQINSLSTFRGDEDIKCNTVNGKVTISDDTAPSSRQFLIANGSVTIAPNAGEALQQYVGVVINGVVYCPDNLSSLLASSATINGKTYIYPADAVILKKNFVLDKTFALRAQKKLYWAPGCIVAVDENIDAAKLSAKGVRFASKKALLGENLDEELAPLFTEETQLEILPAGTKFVSDDIKLTPAVLRRCGARLYVEGDVEVMPECAGKLGTLESLIVKGDIVAPAALEEELLALSEIEYDALNCYRGKLLNDRKDIRVDTALLERCPEGLTCWDFVTLTLDPDVQPELILERLVLGDGVNVECTPAQRSAVAEVSKDIVNIITDGEAEKDNGTQINAMSYIL